MDSFNLDWIAPVIFILIYLASRLFRRRSDDEAEQKPSLPDVEKRTRDIQEEIRRRIAERQRQYEAQRRPVTTQEQPRAPVQSEDEAYQAPARGPAPTLMPQPDLVAAQRRIAAQMEQLQESQARLEESRRKPLIPVSTKSKNANSGVGVRTGRSDLRKVIRRLGSDSHGLRLAFLYGEVLGPPVGIRRHRFMQMFEE